MPVDWRMRNGTPDHSTSTICKQCANGQTIIDDRSNEYTYCHAMIEAKRITVKVVSCSSFQHKNSTSLRDMKQIAWTIDLNKRHMGFIKPKADVLEDE